MVIYNNGDPFRLGQVAPLITVLLPSDSVLSIAVYLMTRKQLKYVEYEKLALKSAYGSGAVGIEPAEEVVTRKESYRVYIQLRELFIASMLRSGKYPPHLCDCVLSDFYSQQNGALWACRVSSTSRFISL